MPTGYTADLTTESSFRHFALSVARRFGALIHMRDEPMDAPITMPKASDYYEKSLTKAKARLAELEAMPEADQRKKAQKDYKNAVKYYNQRCEQASEKREAYRNMLAKVEAWQAPSPEHEGFKADMIRQLTESDQFDNSILDNHNQVPTLQPFAKWYAEQVQKARQDIDYYTKEKLKEDERTAGRCRWIEQLYASLP